MIFVGVDPGKNGAVAAVDGQGSVLGISRFIHAETEGRIALIILDFVAELAPDEIKAATIERVGAMPRQGVVSMFTLGASTAKPGRVCWRRSVGCSRSRRRTGSATCTCRSATA